MSKIKQILSILAVLLTTNTLFSGTVLEQIDSLTTALSRYSSTDTSSEYLNLLYTIGETWHYEEDLDRALEYYRLYKETAERIGNNQHLYYAMMAIGDISYSQANYPVAIDAYYKSLEFSGAIESRTDSAYILRQLGYIQYHLGNMDKAYQFHLKSLKIGEEIGDSVIIANYYYASAQIDTEQNNLGKVMNNLRKALRLFQNANLSVDVSDCYALIGSTYHLMDSLEQAIIYKQKAMEIDSSDNYQYGIAYCSYSLAETYLKMGLPEKALALNQRALEIRKKLGDKEEIINSIYALGEVYEDLGKINIALRHYNHAYELAMDLGVKPIIRDIYKKFSEVYFAKKDYKKAYEYYDKHSALKDSLFNEKTIENIANLSAGYEIEKREQTIDLLKKEQKIAQLESETRIGFLQKGLLAFGFLFILIIGIVGYHQYHKQVAFNQILKKKNNQINSQNKKLATIVRKLENANKDLEQFAYISSHDLKAPLRMIGSYTNLLQRRYRGVFDEDGQTFMTYIIQGVKQMYTLLEDILDYSRIKENTVDFQSIDTNEIVDKVIQNFQVPSEKNIENIITNNLPPILGNPTQVQQLFQNVIGNAIKFVPDSTNPKIEIKATTKSDLVEFSISDNGIGIEKEYQEKIFSAFKRLHTQEEYEGTGIGLAICKKITSKHGGDIWVESDGKSGSTFFFTLKRAHSDV